MARLAVVTGGTRGIGAAVSIALKEKGYQVIANYHHNHQAAQSFSEQYGITVQGWDAGDAQACQYHLQEIQSQYGTVDILVHGAGITRDSFFHKMSVEMWEEVLQTNLHSCFYMVRPIIEAMRQQGFGRIVLISSVNALKGQAGQTNYCATKAGIIGFAKALSLETATKGITVNVIAPGYIKTEMVQAIAEPILEKIIAQIPQGRLGTPQEIAQAIAYLVSEEASYITGETLNINGGLYLH